MKARVAEWLKSDRPLFIYFRNLWVFEFEMDCSATENGWFELKGFVQNIDLSSSSHIDGFYENDMAQVQCTGTANVGLPPHSSINHFAKCGFSNKYSWNSSQCEINIHNWFLTLTDYIDNLVGPGNAILELFKIGKVSTKLCLCTFPIIIYMYN